jgi:RHS repeat-associated protein
MRANKLMTVQSGSEGTNLTIKKITTKLNISLSLCVSFVLSLSLAATILGQDQHTKNNSDQTLRGSGRVNATTLAMEIDIPLGNYQGRGINIPINLSYSSKLWRLAYNNRVPLGNNPGVCLTQYNTMFSENSASGWTSSLAVPYIEYVGRDNIYDNLGFPADFDIECTASPGYTGKAWVKRLVVHLPGGETHELRASDTPIAVATSDPDSQSNWNATFYAVDGSNLKYIEDAGATTPVFRLQMPDGSFYDFATGSPVYAQSMTTRKAATYTDRNGNFTTYHAPTTTYPNGYWTDTLGRNIPIPLSLQPPASPTTQEYDMPGLNNNDITYKFYWKKLKDTNSGNSAITDFNTVLKYAASPGVGSGTYLFSSTSNSRIGGGDLSGYFNPIVLAMIETPNGEIYKFTYDIYGRIERIYYPTGGEERFTYNVVPTISTVASSDINAQVNFGVSSRQIYETAGQGTPAQWDYSVSYTSPHGYKISIEAPDDTVSQRFLHRGNDFCSTCTVGSFGFDNGLAGMPYEERFFSSGGTLLTRKFTHWTKTSSTVSSVATADWHPRIDREESIVYDSSGNGLSSVGIFEFGGNLSLKEIPLLVNKTTQYAFTTTSGGGSISPTATPSTSPTPVPTTTPSTPVKITELSYLIDDTNISSTIRDIYKNQNMVGLVTVSRVKDGSGTTVVAQSETVYDESGLSPAYRGNPTTSKVWDSTKGAVTNSGAYISTYAEYDSYGNQTEVTDALGNTTITAFDSTYHAFPVSVTTAAADQNGGTYGSTTGFTTSATYDSSTPPLGLVMSATDINGQTTTMGYDSATLRQTSVTSPNGQQTQFFYGTPDSYGQLSSSQRFGKVKTQIDASNWSETYNWFDGLGRTYKTQKVDSNGDVFVLNCFDNMGRIQKSSNPFRNVSNPTCSSSLEWTTPTYDSLGRATTLTLPDSATILTAYGISTSGVIGTTKLVTDQAGRKRKGIVDALGRMIRVIEDPDSQNLATDYVFDTLGNLRGTTQGSQNRYFMYDSLGRVTYARQIEQEANTNFSGSGYTDPITSNDQWSVKYQYDDNGNITSTTDARNVSVTGTYDHLNRITFRNYSDTTPDVTFYYDGKGLASIPNYSNNKVTKVNSTVSESKYTSFDNTGRVLASQQITDGETYTFGYAYNLSGALIEQTYPSGRVVKNTLNQDGELSMVKSRKNSNVGYYAYAQSFSYNAAGMLDKMRLGNGHWETYSYNNRSQVTQVGLGTTDVTQDLLKLEYGYETYATSGNHDNNGTMLSQKITVPTVGSYSGFTANQTYIYDSLNRLESAAETISSAQTWKQTFQYDRYGNRRFNTSSNNTTTLSQVLASKVTNPLINTSDNRFQEDQDNDLVADYDYDANGNLTLDAQNKRFVYDAENHQTQFFTTSNNTSTPDATYHYDGEGKRIKKITNTEIVVFVYDSGAQLVAEYSSAPATTQRVGYLTNDHLGSPRIITNEIGQIVERKDYTAFGETTTSAQRITELKYTGQNQNTVREGYSGYEHDMETELEYAQARYYNAGHGRFTSVDSLAASAAIKNPQTFNRYSYVLNSPYKFTDPSGLLSISTNACGQWCSNKYQGEDAGGGGGLSSAILSGGFSLFNWSAEVEGYSINAPGVSEGQTSTQQTTNTPYTATVVVPITPCRYACDFMEADQQYKNYSGRTITVNFYSEEATIDTGGPKGSPLEGDPNYISARTIGIFTLTDDAGNPIRGMVSENIVTVGSNTIQNRAAVPLNEEGQFGDFIDANGGSLRGTSRSLAESTINMTAKQVDQTATLTVTTSNGLTLVVVQRRIFTNTTSIGLRDPNSNGVRFWLLSKQLTIQAYR